jgi:serine/threonine-protein kinase RsbW
MPKRTEQMIGRRDSGGQPISLVIPCKAEYVGLCRLVAGVVGVRESLDEEDVADLKLVVTEACTCFMWGPEGSAPTQEPAAALDPPCSLRIDFNVMPDAWEITISDPEHSRHIVPKGRCTATGEEGGLGLTIIRALVDSMEHIDTEAEGSVIRLVKRLTPRPTRPR